MVVTAQYYRLMGDRNVGIISISMKDPPSFFSLPSIRASP